MDSEAAWQAKRAELLRQIERVRPDTETYSEVRPETAPGLEREEQHGRISPPAERQPFGRWLVTQKDRDGWIGDLARAAAADRSFPRSGDPEAVRAHLRAQMAEGDMFAAVDDAEVDWLSY